MREIKSSQPVHDLAAVSMRNIPEHRIDMAPHNFDSECARLVGQLKALDLYRDDLGFTVIHPELLGLVRSTGTYRTATDGEPKKTIWCLRAGEDLYGEPSLVAGHGTQKWSDYVSFDDAAIKAGIPLVVYDMSKLEATKYRDKYRFTSDKKLDAVVAFLILDNY